MLTLYPKVSKQNISNFPDQRFFPFAIGVNENGGAPLTANFSANFRKNVTALMGYSGAWGKLIHKNPEVENLVALFL
jgi:hypothetical protein